ncbi:MAG: MoaD family protein [Dehalococcoidia bacterium]
MIQKVVENQRQFEADGGTIAELMTNIEQRYPGFREQITDEAGEFHRFVNIYLNDEDIRYLDGPQTELSDGDAVSILPALAGG